LSNGPPPTHSRKEQKPGSQSERDGRLRRVGREAVVQRWNIAIQHFPTRRGIWRPTLQSNDEVSPRWNAFLFSIFRVTTDKLVSIGRIHT
jgi:hypothetical protein